MDQWSQVTASRRWMLLGVGVLVCLIALYVFLWSAFLDDIDRLKSDIQQLEQENRAARFKTTAFQNVDQQWIDMRQDLREVNPQHFRKDVMDLSKNFNVTMNSWKPETLGFREEQAPQNLKIAMRVKGRFYQGISFLRGLEQLPWVQSISSVKAVRLSTGNGETTIVMDIKIQAMTPSVFEQVKKLLAA
mgnify:CR=1 FL=1